MWDIIVDEVRDRNGNERNFLGNTHTLNGTFRKASYKNKEPENSNVVYISEGGEAELHLALEPDSYTISQSLPELVAKMDVRSPPKATRGKKDYRKKDDGKYDADLEDKVNIFCNTCVFPDRDKGGKKHKGKHKDHSKHSKDKNVNIITKNKTKGIFTYGGAFIPWLDGNDDPVNIDPAFGGKGMSFFIKYNGLDWFVKAEAEGLKKNFDGDWGWNIRRPGSDATFINMDADVMYRILGSNNLHLDAKTGYEHIGYDDGSKPFFLDMGITAMDYDLFDLGLGVKFDASNDEYVLGFISGYAKTFTDGGSSRKSLGVKFGAETNFDLNKLGVGATVEYLKTLGAEDVLLRGNLFTHDDGDEVRASIRLKSPQLDFEGGQLRGFIGSDYVSANHDFTALGHPADIGDMEYLTDNHYDRLSFEIGFIYTPGSK